MNRKYFILHQKIQKKKDSFASSSKHIKKIFSNGMRIRY